MKVIDEEIEDFDPKEWVEIDGEMVRREDAPIEYDLERFESYLSDLCSL